MTRIERFLLDINQFDSQLTSLDADKVLDAAIRRKAGAHGIKRAAGALYDRADMLAAAGIDDAPLPHMGPQKGQQIEHKAEAPKKSRDWPSLLKRVVSDHRLWLGVWLGIVISNLLRLMQAGVL